MKKIIALAAGATLAIGCSSPAPFPKPKPTPSETVAPVKPSEQQCFDDAVIALRAMKADPDHNYKRPDTCNNLSGGEDRYWEIHELALLKVTVNG